VELKEVQSALNDCQNDIVDQLTEFKHSVNNEVLHSHHETLKILDSKAGALDI